MKLKLTAIILLSLILNKVKAQSRYNIIYEPQLGQNFAAENLNAGFHLLDYVDSLAVEKRIIKTENTFAKVINPIFRFSKLFLNNYLITDYVMTMNHERYGHGYRILEAGGYINEIVYNPPPPFSNKSSYISFQPPPSFNDQQDIMTLLGGSETNLVFSDVMRKNILLDERFNYNFGLAYLYGSNDMPGYTAFVSNPNGDPKRYLKKINDLYGPGLTREKMRTYSFIAMLTDPMNFYALKSVFYDYIIKGRHSSKIGMIKLSNRLKYLPRFRFEYTPYGPELVYQNYFKLDSKLIQFSFSHSDPNLPKSWRVKANIWNIKLSDNLSCNLSGQMWNQPNIDFFHYDGLISSNPDPIRSKGFGGQFVSTINYDVNKNKNYIGYTLQLGYKSTGYAIGEQLNKGLIMRGGLTFKLSK
ncbi:MAG: hypothetical protein P8I43_06645 [Bacteroidia bacterium]|nr:hypothetical protein [Bacteroidia bacterium]MDG2042370.1 hypothetical protein [Bacteroidia bacterium]